MSSLAPSEEVRAAFGVKSPLSPLTGGSHVCYSDGDIVLRPSDDDDESNWVANTLSSLLKLQASTEYRVPKPVESIQDPGTYVVDGWTALGFIPGQSKIPILFKESLRVSQAFHEDLSKLNLQRPHILDTRLTRWSEADLVIWGEKQLSEVANVNKEVLAIFDEALTEYHKLTKPLPADLPSQPIHGDLTGNILFDDEGQGPPGIIDMTFYWRPAAFAEAIIVADGMIWYKQGRELVELYGADETRLQLLVRALHWRCLTFAIDPSIEWIQVNIPKVDFIGAARLVGDMMKDKAEECCNNSVAASRAIS